MAGKFGKKVRYQKKFFNIYTKPIQFTQKRKEKIEKKPEKQKYNEKLHETTSKKSGFGKLFDLFDLWD